MAQNYIQLGKQSERIKSKSLIDLTTRLERLLQRADLTEYERGRYQADFVRLIRKCQKLPIELDFLANNLPHAKGS